MAHPLFRSMCPTLLAPVACRAGHIAGPRLTGTLLSFAGLAQDLVGLTNVCVQVRRKHSRTSAGLARARHSYPEYCKISVVAEPGFEPE